MNVDIQSPEAAGIQDEQGTLFDRSVCLVLKRSTFNTTRKVKGGPTMVAAQALQTQPDMVRLSKKLFVAPEYRAITSRDNEFDEWLGTVRLPSLLRSGSHSIPIPLVERVEMEVQRYAAERRTLVTNLAAAWARIVSEAAELLGDQVFDSRNYPTAEHLVARFDVEWNWISYGTPAKLKTISAALFTVEREKAAAQIKNVQDEAVQEIRGRMLDLVSHVVERLTPDDDGKKKTFRKSMLDNLKEFLDVFPTLEQALGGDPESAALVMQAKGLMDGVDPELLRSDDLARRKIAEGFASIRAALDASTEKRGKRQIRFAADEAPDDAAAAAWQKAHEAFGAAGGVQ